GAGPDAFRARVVASRLGAAGSFGVGSRALLFPAGQAVRGVGQSGPVPALPEKSQRRGLQVPRRSENRSGLRRDAAASRDAGGARASGDRSAALRFEEHSPRQAAQEWAQASGSLLQFWR